MEATPPAWTGYGHAHVSEVALVNETRALRGEVRGVEALEEGAAALEGVRLAQQNVDRETRRVRVHRQRSLLANSRGVAHDEGLRTAQPRGRQPIDGLRVSTRVA